jgi:hypothetical protein
VTNSDNANWLRACIGPDQSVIAKRLEAEIDLAASAPFLLQGDALELLPNACSQVPADTLPVVITTWTLSQFSFENRLHFLRCLDKAAARRPLAWVSVEGVGVAPTIPTLGERYASGHSIIGMSIFNRATVEAENLGRCWLQGRFLAWLPNSTPSLASDLLERHSGLRLQPS